ncbi:MAG: hypothetical protein EOO02_04445, partial [Chitinophagaceae bacterium]
MKVALRIHSGSGVDRNGMFVLPNVANSINLRLDLKLKQMPVFNESFSIPVSLPGKQTLPINGIKIIAGDVGGTKTNLALYHATRNKLELLAEKRYLSLDYDSVAAMIQLSIWERFTSSEIGTLLDLPAETVRTRLRRAR